MRLKSVTTVGREWMQDLRIAVRSARRTPLQALVIILTLGLGIGATTTVFAVAHSVLIRDLPFAAPERLAFVWYNAPAAGDQRIPVPAPDAAELAANARSLESVAFSNRVADVTLTAERGAERLRVALVTQNFFGILGATPAIGRTFRPGEALLPPDFDDEVAPPPPSSIVLSHDLWRGRFGADPAILGRSIELNGQPATVIGVMPHDFMVPYPPGSGFPPIADAWMPLRSALSEFRRADGLIDQDSDNSGAMIARLAPGATFAAAGTELQALSSRLFGALPSHRGGALRTTVAPLMDDAVAHVRPVIAALLGAAVLLYLVACLNVGGLLLASLGSRERELGVRSALGASRARLARQMMAETAAFAIAGAALGIGAALGGLRVVESIRPAYMPRVQAAEIGLPVLAVVVAAALVAMLLVGLGIAVRAGDIGERRAFGARGATPGDRRGVLGQRALVVVQIALAVTLACGGGLLIRSLTTLAAIEPGFEPRGALAFDVSLRAAERHRSPGARAAAIRELETALRALPTVQAVGVAGRLPLGERRWTNRFAIGDEPLDAGSAQQADFRMVTPEYFTAMSTRVLAGRPFTEEENRTEDRRVVIVDRLIAERVAPGGLAVGQFLRFPLDGREVRAEIVGVVEPVRFASLAEPARGAFYVPYRHEASRDVSIVMRTSGDPASVAPAVRRLVHAVDPDIPVYNVAPLARHVADSLATLRLAVRLLTGFALLAIALSLLGVFALLARSVATRRREIGVRLALGAREADVLREVLGSGGTLVAVGITGGLVLALVLTRVLASLLFGVGSADPVVMAVVSGAVGVTGLLAALVPAWSASRTDPLEAIRER
jgi:predicted permease